MNTAVRRIAFTREQEEQIRAVLDDPKYRILNKTELKVVFYIGMFTGQRLKDCVLLQWQNVDMEHHKIFVKQFKTGKEVSIPIAPLLYQVLLEAQGSVLPMLDIEPFKGSGFNLSNQQAILPLCISYRLLA